MNISGRIVGPSNRPFLIAEMSGNHNQSLERALEIVEAAAKAGADALKIQTYTADTMTLDIAEGSFYIDDAESLWKGRSLHQLYHEAHTPWDWHRPILSRAKELGLIAFSTPFDASAVEFLESLDVPAYKIASFENVDLALIRKVSSTGKPVIVSTGMATVAEIEAAVAAARSAGCKELALLKCTSTYPASPGNTNILTIPHMRQLFGCEVGLSDHTMGVGVAVAATALGATLIEKHFTLARADGGVDSTFSLEPDEFGRLREETERAWLALGSVAYGPSAAEIQSMIFRRSLYVVKDLAPGDALTRDSVRAIRPGYGMAPKYLEEVLGMRVQRRVMRGTPLSWSMFKPEDPT